MLQLNYIRENTQEVIDKLGIKNIDAKEIILKVIDFDNKRKKTQKLLDDILFESNNLAKKIGVLFKNSKQQEANILKEKTAKLKNESKELNDNFCSKRKTGRG